MASSGTHLDTSAVHGLGKTSNTESSAYFQRLLALRRGRPIESNQGLITAFALICSFVVMVTYLETSRVLLPTKVVTKRELRTLTSGFTNDLPIKNSKDQAWATSGQLQPRRPKVLFVGFSNCGGKGIMSILGSHPDITVNTKEIKYFTTGNVSLKWYLTHMPPSPPHHTTVDFCWSCIINRSSLKKIRAFNETIKIVVVVCDPISRLLATHARLPTQRHKPHNEKTKKTPNPITYDVDSLKTKISVNFSLLNNLNPRMLTDNGDFFRHIVDLHEVFSRKQVHVIDRDRFRRKFVSELYKVHKFIGVVPQTELIGLSYDKDRETMCYNFSPGLQTCLDDTYQNITEIFDEEPRLLKSLKQFYRPYSRRLFVYLNHKYNWAC